MSATYQSILTGILTLVAGGIGYFLRKEVDRKYILELEIIKQGLQRELEGEKTRQQIKFKAELVAELLAVWISNPTELTELNRLCYLAFLWLPDDIALELSALLSKIGSAKSVPNLIVKVRSHLLGQTAISEGDIITFLNSGRDYKTLPASIIPDRDIPVDE